MQGKDFLGKDKRLPLKSFYIFLLLIPVFEADLTNTPAAGSSILSILLEDMSWIMGNHWVSLEIIRNHGSEYHILTFQENQSVAWKLSIAFPVRPDADSAAATEETCKNNMGSQTVAVITVSRV